MSVLDAWLLRAELFCKGVACVLAAVVAADGLIPGL